jgi:hypothetical protein
MGKDARLRAIARRLHKEPPTRYVPSKRGLATMFTLCGLLGFGAGAAAYAVRAHLAPAAVCP